MELLSPLCLWLLFWIIFGFLRVCLFCLLVVVVLHCKYHDGDSLSERGLFNNLFPIY